MLACSRLQRGTQGKYSAWYSDNRDRSHCLVPLRFSRCISIPSSSRSGLCPCRILPRFIDWQNEQINQRRQDRSIAPTSFLWNAYYPNRYYFEVNTAEHNRSTYTSPRLCRREPKQGIVSNRWHLVVAARALSRPTKLKNTTSTAKTEWRQ